MENIEESIAVQFSGTIYGVEAYKWMEMSSKEKEEQILKFKKKINLIKYLCKKMGAEGVHDLAKILRKELRLALRNYGNIRKCSNCRFCWQFYDMPMDKAKDLVEAYLDKKKVDKNVISELRDIKDYKKLRTFIEKHLLEYKAALIGVIFDIGPYCSKLKACIREQSFAMVCDYFPGR